MVKAEKEYLIHKPPVSALLIFALPMMLGNFFQQAYTMADSVIVGRFVGEDALAAVGALLLPHQCVPSPSPSAGEWGPRSSPARPSAAGTTPG